MPQVLQNLQVDGKPQEHFQSCFSLELAFFQYYILFYGTIPVNIYGGNTNRK